MKTRLNRAIGHRQSGSGFAVTALPLWLAAQLATVSALAQPVPHHFSGITPTTEGTVLLSLDGSVSNMFNLTTAISNQFRQMFDLYPVEASSNLLEWTRLALLLRTNNDSNPLRFVDTHATGLDRCFYRTPTNHFLTAFPKPTGPYAVGRLDRILTDSSRSSRYGITTNSSFMSTFWYPAELPGGGTFPVAYAEPQVVGDRSLLSFWGHSTLWTQILPRCVGHGIPDLPLVAGTNRFPVIVHSHGWTCDRRYHSHLAEELASHGYIVAAVDHEDCHATVYPDARTTRYVEPGSRNDPSLLTSRVKDIQCLLDALAVLDGSDPMLAGRSDLTRIGATGYSLGAGTAAESCRLEERIKCAALLDGFLMLSSGTYPGLNTSGLQKPLLAMTRTILDHADRLWDASPDSGRLFALARQDAVWLRFANTGHFAFSDCAWAVELTSSSRQGAKAIDACVVWFFDTYLKGESPAFPTNAEIINVQRK